MRIADGFIRSHRITTADEGSSASVQLQVVNKVRSMFGSSIKDAL
jgi:hypothetical protein